ncbi:uncharacterized protein LOC125179566 isoform X2 [Hyalella azteca]|nr:uncharacterized protein LOC125179566 isoform X2 [Hyalella azteca]
MSVATGANGKTETHTEDSSNWETTPRPEAWRLGHSHASMQLEEIQEDELSERIATLMPIWYRFNQMKRTINIRTSELPRPWSQLQPIKKFLLVLAINPAQCYDALQDFVHHTYPTAARDSFSTICFAQEYFKLPKVLHSKQKLSLPKRPLLLLTEFKNTICTPDVIWQPFGRDITVLSLPLLKQNGQLKATLTRCMQRGKFLALQDVHRCSLEEQKKLYHLLYRFYDTFRAGSHFEQYGELTNDAPFRFRVALVADARAEICAPLHAFCSVLWLQDAASLREALPPAVSAAAHAIQRWPQSALAVAGDEMVLNGMLVVVSLFHAVLWLWKSFGPWEGIKPELRITDIQLVLKVLKTPNSINRLLLVSELQEKFFEVYLAKLADERDQRLLRILSTELLKEIMLLKHSKDGQMHEKENDSRLAYLPVGCNYKEFISKVIHTFRTLRCNVFESIDELKEIRLAE